MRTYNSLATGKSSVIYRKINSRVSGNGNHYILLSWQSPRLSYARHEGCSFFHSEHSGRAPREAAGSIDSAQSDSTSSHTWVQQENSHWMLGFRSEEIHIINILGFHL